MLPVYMMMTTTEMGTEVPPAGVYALRKVGEWKPEMLWHPRIGHAPLNAAHSATQNAVSTIDAAKQARRGRKLARRSPSQRGRHSPSRLGTAQARQSATSMATSGSNINGGH